MIALGDERAHRIRIRVVVRDEVSAGMFAEYQRGTLERTTHAVPRKVIRERIAGSPETFLSDASHARVHTIGADDQIAIQCVNIIDSRTVPDLDSEVFHVSLQDGQQGNA